MNLNQNFGQRTKNNKYQSYNMWQDSQYFDSSNFDLQRSYQEYKQKTECPIESEVLRDYKNRRIITRSSLYEDPDLFKFQNQDDSEIIADKNATNSEVPESSSSNNHWTSGQWRKVNEASDVASSSQSTGPTRKVKLNKLERKLDEALSKPVQFSKGESMMQRMGWKGGALGKQGNGILEPIAPNAAYAISNIGFGHKVEDKPKPQPPPRKPAETKKPRLQKKALRKFKKNNFQANVLLTIWDFIRNDRELEIVFDCKLKNYERKDIHQLTESLNEGEMVFDTVQQMDIAAAIHKCNVYKLNTESEGVQPNRSLCLFKSGPDNVFLITPYEFLPEDPEEIMEITDGNPNENEDSSKKVTDPSKSIAKKNTKINKVDTTEVNKKLENEKISDDIKISPRNVALNSVIDLTEDKTDEVDLDATNPFLASISRHISNNKNETETKVEETEPKAEETQTKHKERETQVEKTEPKLEETDTKVEKPETEVKKMECLIIEEDFEAVGDIIDIYENFIDTTHENRVKNKVEDTNKELKEKLTATEKSELLLEYFTEFCETDECTEFRFCGAFDDEEYYIINKFIHHFETCLAEPHMCKDVFLDARFADLVSKVHSNFEVSEDVNGHTVIYRRQKKR